MSSFFTWFLKKNCKLINLLFVKNKNQSLTAFPQPLIVCVLLGIVYAGTFLGYAGSSFNLSSYNVNILTDSNLAKLSCTLLSSYIATLISSTNNNFWNKFWGGMNTYRDTLL